MAFQPLSAGYTLFPHQFAVGGFASGNLGLSASTHRVGLVIQVPKTGTLDKFAAWVSVVANAPDNGLRFSFQDVSSTGINDGVVDQFATVASGSVTVGWLDPGAFDAGRSVTKGDVVALVVDYPSFVAGDSVSIGRIGQDLLSLPYGIITTGSKDGGSIPSFALHYDDGTWVHLPYVCPSTGVTALSFNSSSTPDEWGLAFQLPFPARLVGVQPHISLATCNMELVFYDDTGTEIEAVPWVAENAGNTGTVRPHPLLFDTAKDLDANAIYRVSIRPTEASSGVTINYATIPNSSVFACWEGGSSLYACSRTNAGSWTDYNNGTDGYRMVPFSLMLAGFDDATGGGGSTETSHVF